MAKILLPDLVGATINVLPFSYCAAFGYDAVWVTNTGNVKNIPDTGMVEGKNQGSVQRIDPNTNKWKQSWAGSYANGVQEFTNGEYRDSAMHFDFETKNAQGNKTARNIGHP